jgi:hypothetical protein
MEFEQKLQERAQGDVGVQTDWDELERYLSTSDGTIDETFKEEILEPEQRKRKMSVEGKKKDITQLELVHKHQQKKHAKTIAKKTDQIRSKLEEKKDLIHKQKKNLQKIEEEFKAADMSMYEEVGEGDKVIKKLEKKKKVLRKYIEKKESEDNVFGPGSPGRSESLPGEMHTLQLPSTPGKKIPKGVRGAHNMNDMRRVSSETSLHAGALGFLYPPYMRDSDEAFVDPSSPISITVHDYSQAAIDRLMNKRTPRKKLSSTSKLVEKYVPDAAKIKVSSAALSVSERLYRRPKNAGTKYDPLNKINSEKMAAVSAEGTQVPRRRGPLVRLDFGRSARMRSSSDSSPPPRSPSPTKSPSRSKSKSVSRDEVSDKSSNSSDSPSELAATLKGQKTLAEQAQEAIRSMPTPQVVRRGRLGGLRHYRSASSLANVPEAIAEEQEEFIEPRRTQSELHIDTQMAMLGADTQHSPRDNHPSERRSSDPGGCGGGYLETALLLKKLNDLSQSEHSDSDSDMMEYHVDYRRQYSPGSQDSLGVEPLSKRKRHSKSMESLDSSTGTGTGSVVTQIEVGDFDSDF